MQLMFFKKKKKNQFQTKDERDEVMFLVSPQ